MKHTIRIRYMTFEVVNSWAQDSPDFDEKQEELILEINEPPSINQILEVEIHGRTTFLCFKKVIMSNKTREDGLTAFVQAEIVSAPKKTIQVKQG